MKNHFLTALLFLFLSSCNYRAQQQPPNFIIIYADDLGYGDVSSYGVGRLQRLTLIKSQITVLVSPMAIQVQLLAALVVMRF